jgi:hypothetical protein
MNNKNYFTKYLILVLPLLFINLNAQDQVDPLEAARLAKSAAEKAQAEADAATEAAIQSAATKAAAQARENAVQAKKDAEAKKLADAKAAEEAELDALAKAAGEEAKRKIAQELGLDDGSSEEETTAEETESTEVAAEEVEAAEEEVEELAVKESSGYNIGFSGSLGLIKGGFFDNIPTGGSLVITTPWGFDVAGIRFGLSATVGAYPATAQTNGTSFTPIAVGVGGNITLASVLFAEGHIGNVGNSTGARGFAGVSLEKIMKKGLNLPFNVLVGAEGFMSNQVAEWEGSATYWGGLAFRIDYSL